MDPSARDVEWQTPPANSSLNSKYIPEDETEKAAGVKEIHGWRRVVLHFTPSWFASIMGTGMVSMLLHLLPYNANWLQWIAIVIFALNVVLFVLFTTISTMRYIMFPGIWTYMINHTVQSLFLGTFPMGLCTIINMIVFVCVPAWGEGALILAWSLWWIDVALSFACCMYMPFVIMHIHDNHLSKMTAAWLLPIISCIVCSSSGAILAEALETGHPDSSLWTLIMSYIQWGAGVSLAMVVLVIYFQRLAFHHLPPREVIVSVFLPLGPLGQGGFAIQKLGEVAHTLLPAVGVLPLVPIAGSILYVIGFAVALVFFGFSLCWMFFAIASITRSRFPFNMGAWSFVFPIGTVALSTIQLAKELPSPFFKVLGTIIALCVVILWIVVSGLTIQRSISGTLFSAPCVRQYQEEKARKESTSSDRSQSVTVNGSAV